MAEAEHLRALGARRIEVIPLGVDVPISTRVQRNSAGRLCILFLSRLHPKKGIPVLLEAVRLVRDDGTPVSLTIAGTGAPDYEAQLRSAAERAGIADLITWAGHVEGRPKAELFAQSDVFVLPSSQENFGIAVAEALAAGLPVIVSHEVAIGREAEAAGAGRSLPIDARQFADAIIDYARHPESRVAAGRAAARFAIASYSWPACAERLEALYRAVSNPGASRTPPLRHPPAAVSA
jgi:glycosyltransferase involved in cell wall biosynthesis